VAEVNLDPELAVQVLSYVLRTIYGAVLAAGAAEGNLKVGESTVEPALRVEIDKGIYAGEELEYFAVALQEVDDGLVEPCDGLVLGIAAGIVRRAAVEDISAAVARGVLRYALLEGEGEDADDEPLVGLERGNLVEELTGCVGGEPAQHRLQAGICRCRPEPELRTQIVERRGDAVDEVTLLLPQSAIAIGSEHLQDAEEDEEVQTPQEVLACKPAIAGGSIGRRDVSLQALPIDVDELAAKVVAVARRCLPEETGYVVVDGSATAALEVYIVGLAAVEHDVAGLEVAIEERVGILAEQVAAETVEVSLQGVFVELQSAELEEAVLEVVEVEHDRCAVHLSLRIAVAEDVGRTAAELQVGQVAHDPAQHGLLRLGIVSACLPALSDVIEERKRAKVLLDIDAAVIGRTEDLRHRQLLTAEMAREGDEGAVLLGTGAYAAYIRCAVGSLNAVVAAVAARTGQLTD